MVVRGEMVSFESLHSDEEAISALENIQSSHFIQGLLRSRNNLSPKQLSWVHYLVKDTQISKSPLQKLEDLIREEKINNKFACDLVMNSKKYSLSAKQMFWVKKIVNDWEKENMSSSSGSVQNTEPLNKSENMDPIEKDMLVRIPNFIDVILRMDKAAQKLKKPKIVFEHEGISARFSRDSSGCVTVNINTVTGCIDREGEFQVIDGNVTEEIVTLLCEISADPVAYAAKYGLGSGKCCFCTRPLCDKRALAMGYGKVCAHRYNMPWGEKKLSMSDVLE